MAVVSLYLAICLFFARRRAAETGARLRATQREFSLRWSDMYAQPVGSDRRGFAAASIYLDLPTLHAAEDANRKAQAEVRALMKRLGRDGWWPS